MGAEASFYHRFEQLSCRYADLSSNPFFRPQWREVPSFQRHWGEHAREWAASIDQTAEEVACRERVLERFCSGHPNLAVSAIDSDQALPVRVQISFQVVRDFDTTKKILAGGLAEGSDNGGLYGLGSYFTMDLDYALSSYAKADSQGLCTVVVFAVVYGSPYPVIENPWEKNTMLLRPCVPRHDAHIVLVDGSSDPALPVSHRHWSSLAPRLVTELVLFEKAQALPLGVLRLQAPSCGWREWLQAEQVLPLRY